MATVDKGPHTIRVTATLAITSIIIIFLRLCVRLQAKNAAGWDDFFIFISGIAISISTVMVSQQVKWGFGKHMRELSESMQSHMFFYYWLDVIFYQASIGFTRISIIFQYLRIFAVTKATRITLICMLICVALYTLQAVIVTIFSCTPVSDFWNDENPGPCIDIKAFWVFHALFTVLIDIPIIYLPISVTRCLNIPRKQKIILMALLSLVAIGGTITSVIRLFYIYTLTYKTDTWWENVDVTIWSSVEINAAVICASLPTFKSLIGRMFPRLLFNGHNSNKNDPGREQRIDH